MPNWDDEFDLDDYNPKKPAEKPKQQKKQNNDDDFFDLDDVPPSNAKLPTLNSKANKQQPALPPSKSSNKYDEYEEIDEEVEVAKSPAKKQPEKNNYADLYDDQEEIKPSVNRQPSINKQSSQPKKAIAKQTPKVVKQQQDDEQFYESLEQNKPKVVAKSQPQTVKKQQKQQPQANYEEQFDQYGQDFEEIEQKPVQLPKKSQTTVNLKPKEKAQSKDTEKLKTQEKKLVINTNKVFMSKQQKEKDKPIVPPKPPMKQKSKQPSKKTIEQQKKHTGPAVSQQKPMQRSASKRSLQSNDSRKHLGNSKVTVRQRTIEMAPSRHLDMVQKQFPDGQERINEYPPDRVSRLNEQVREMIRKFNEQLNELINRNMILLKDKPAERAPKAQEKQRILEQQLKSGATALQVVENQLDRLRGREGELREEQYQLIMEKRIEQVKETIKQTSKLVIKLKAEVTSEGNKLSKKEVERRMAQQLHQIKMMLIQTKKEEEKNENKLEKVEKMAEQLQSKNGDKEYELSEQMDNARDKGLTLNIKQTTKKKYEQLKIKSLTLQNHKRVTESLAKTKCDHLNHENDQIRNALRSLESQIANLHQSIEHSQEQSIKLIKKTKENAKIPTSLSDTLDKILKSIEGNQALNYYQVRTQGNNSQASERPLKNSMYQNMGGKEKPVMRGTSSKKQPGSATRQKVPTPPPVAPPVNDDINLMKPNFMKKKEKPEGSPVQDKQKANKERIWNEQEQKHKKQQQKRKQQQQKLRLEQKRKEEQAQRLAATEQQKKKPFNLKKNRLNNQQRQKIVEPSPQVSKIASTLELKLPTLVTDQKEEEKPSIGPKFMRLNRKDKNNEGNKNDISVQKPIEQIKKPTIQELPKTEVKPEQDQPVFAPKRFNLRNKIQKKDQGYVPTADKSMEVKKVQPKKEQSKKQQPKKEYAPNFSFKQQDPFKLPITEGKKVENDIRIDVPEEKPKFNLRLRDRQKKEAEDSYVPSRLTQVDPKPKAQTGVYNPFDREPLKKEQTKPYQLSFKPAQQKIVKPSLDITPTTRQISKQTIISNQPVNNPYAQATKQEPITNPYAPKEQAPKREREGPLKKNKLLNKGPKEKINIYQQAEDITQAAHVPVHEPQKQVPVNQPLKQLNLAKTNELDLNAMLGIKKKQKANDLDDLLGDISVGNKKQKKKNTDFFNDLEI